MPSTKRKRCDTHRDGLAARVKSRERRRRVASNRSDESSPYSALDKDRMEIRLLLVKAGSDEQPLQCQLRQAFLTSKPIPEYETISYRWGDSKITGTIILNGKETTVPASAAAALRCMRLRNADRILWIDAVCIDQKDEKERGHQVAMMYEVYSNGQRNLIHLGEDGGTTAKAIEIMYQVLEDASEETYEFEEWREMLYNHHGNYQHSETGIELAADLNPLYSFFSAPWFGRLWVAQEAALSRSNQCYCGQVEIGLKIVLRAARWLLYKNEFVPHELSGHPGIQNAAELLDYCDPELGIFRTSDGFKATLWDLLICLRDFEVDNPQDRIYGILGLYQKLNGSSRLTEYMAPDYTKSLQCILRDATKYIIEEFQQLNVLAEIIENPWDATADRSWPSWVPHWHTKDKEGVAPWSLATSYRADNRVKHDRAKIEVAHVLRDSDCDRLVLRGFDVDSVLALLPVVREESLNDLHDTLRIIKDIHALLAKYCDSTHTLGATLIAKSTHDARRASKKYCSNYSIWMEHLKKIGIPPRLGEISQLDEEDDKDTIAASQYNHAFCKAIENRRFFVTTSGYIGLGPRTMETQDIVAVVYGCDVPVVLRPHGEHYRIHGACYVHGIMDGEFVKKCKAEGKPDEEFVIV